VVLSNGWELSTFAAQMSGLSSDGIDFYTIPTLGEAKIGGADVIEVDPKRVARFVESLTADETSPSTPPSSSDPVPTTTSVPTTSVPTTSVPTEDGRPSLGLVTVDVRNGSDTSGLASAVRDDLAERGFNPGQVGDAAVRATSVIRYAPGEQNLAQYAADELGGGFQLEEDTNQPSGRLWIVLGTDYQAPAGLVGDRLVTLGQPDTSTSPGQPPSSAIQPPPQLNADELNCVN
jgi:LytR cell envelope-related transcriptional attenuator